MAVRYATTDGNKKLTSEEASGRIRSLQRFFPGTQSENASVLASVTATLRQHPTKQGTKFWLCKEDVMFTSESTPAASATPLHPICQVGPAAMKRPQYIRPDSYESAAMAFHLLGKRPMDVVILAAVFNKGVYNDTPTGFMATTLTGDVKVWFDYRYMELDIFNMVLLEKQWANRWIVVWNPQSLMAMKSTFGLSFKNVLILQTLLFYLDPLWKDPVNLEPIAAALFGKTRLIQWAEEDQLQNHFDDKDSLEASNTLLWVFKMATMFITTYNGPQMVQARKYSCKWNSEKVVINEWFEEALERAKTEGDRGYAINKYSGIQTWAEAMGLRSGNKPSEILSAEAVIMGSVIPRQTDPSCHANWVVFSNKYLKKVSPSSKKLLQDIVEQESLKPLVMDMQACRYTRILNSVRLTRGGSKPSNLMVDMLCKSGADQNDMKVFFCLNQRLTDCNLGARALRNYQYELRGTTATHLDVYELLCRYCVPLSMTKNNFKTACSTHTIPANFNLPNGGRLIITEKLD